MEFTGPPRIGVKTRHIDKSDFNKIDDLPTLRMIALMNAIGPICEADLMAFIHTDGDPKRMLDVIGRIGTIGMTLMLNLLENTFVEDDHVFARDALRQVVIDGFSQVTM